MSAKKRKKQNKNTQKKTPPKNRDNLKSQTLCLRRGLSNNTRAATLKFARGRISLDGRNVSRICRYLFQFCFSSLTLHLPSLWSGVSRPPFREAPYILSFLFSFRAPPHPSLFLSPSAPSPLLLYFSRESQPVPQACVPVLYVPSFISPECPEYIAVVFMSRWDALSRTCSAEIYLANMELWK